eukprot:CAMPEP_0202979802 /NCGR_PEP_ID=MMETSP1396-20130829/85858_1 /ASSEMBLY_ACC=CAM_ASM_000872 /TAXON_ID= /ORGANISM="Pseudokeronopsis sp., Strain Brazil" /LENGTH=127 /DNA_ID=CAMNT_0049719405 /DNA_START=834 /DNA_END=1217 /DNA_ORIENTATION=-
MRTYRAVTSLSIAGKSNGVDKRNQDAFREILTYKKLSHTSLFLLADGHGQNGDEVSKYVIDRFPINLGMEITLKKDGSQVPQRKESNDIFTNISQRKLSDPKPQLDYISVKECFLNAFRRTNNDIKH